MSDILTNQAQLVANNTSIREQVLSMVRDLPEQQVDPSIGATATADKILEGYTAAVNGELLTGIMSAGVSGIDYGVVTLASTQPTVTISHNLSGATRAFLIPYKITITSNQIEFAHLNNDAITVSGNSSPVGSYVKVNGASGYLKATGTITDTTVTFPENNTSTGMNRPYAIGTWLWIVMV